LNTSTGENVMALFYTSYDLLGTYRSVTQKNEKTSVIPCKN